MLATTITRSLSLAVSFSLARSLHFFLNSGTVCQTDCGVGFYPSTVTQECEECHDSCRDCVGPSSAACTSCDAPLFLLGTECAEACPSGYFADVDSRTCRTCRECPLGSFKTGGCSGESDTTCEVCFFSRRSFLLCTCRRTFMLGASRTVSHFFFSFFFGCLFWLFVCSCVCSCGTPAQLTSSKLWHQLPSATASANRAAKAAQVERSLLVNAVASLAQATQPASRATTASSRTRPARAHARPAAHRAQAGPSLWGSAQPPRICNARRAR